MTTGDKGGTDHEQRPPQKKVDASVPRQSIDLEGDGTWVLTNRYNLLEMLSSRLIAPKAAYAKHYADLLDFVEDHIVLLNGVPGRSLHRLVEREGANNFPVLLELDPMQWPAEAASRGVLLSTSAIPWSRVRRVHFPNADALREHRSRHYDNVPPLVESQTSVSPGLFEQDRDKDRDTAVLEVLQAGRREDHATDWTRLDRLRGAASAMLMSLRARVAAEKIVDVLAHPDKDSLLARVVLARAPQDVSDADALLLTAVTQVFDDVDASKSWSPRKVLRRIESTVDGLSPDGAHQELAKNLAALHRVVSGEKDFVPFSSPPRGLASARALLLVLLRPDLDRLFSWSREETNVDDETLLMAAGLVGRLRGLTGEAMTHRSTAFDDATAEWVAESSAEGQAPLFDLRVVRRDSSVAIFSGADELVSASQPTGALNRWQALREDERLRLAGPLGQALGADLLVTIIHIHGPFQTRVEDTAVVLKASGSVLTEQRVDERALLDVLDRAPDAAAAVMADLLDGLKVTGQSLEH